MARDEQSYIEGSRRAWTGMLRLCIAELGEADREKHAWILERQETVAMLRRVCALVGDNDWPENLHLGDVIEKHLYRHLAEHR